MPMDGVMLGFVARELDSVLRDGRVDRVVLSASASAARAHLSSHAKTGPMEPPMLCMLLRKYLCGGRVLSVQRIAGDRILKIDISNLSELGDPVTRTLIIEIMGRHSNIILCAADGRIIDAARHVGQDISRVRQVMPPRASSTRTPPRAPRLQRRSSRQAASSTRLSAHPSPDFRLRLPMKPPRASGWTVRL